MMVDNLWTTFPTSRTGVVSKETEHNKYNLMNLIYLDTSISIPFYISSTYIVDNVDIQSYVVLFE